MVGGVGLRHIYGIGRLLLCHVHGPNGHMAVSRRRRLPLEDGGPGVDDGDHQRTVAVAVDLLDGLDDGGGHA